MARCRALHRGHRPAASPLAPSRGLAARPLQVTRGQLGAAPLGAFPEPGPHLPQEAAPAAPLRDGPPLLRVPPGAPALCTRPAGDCPDLSTPDPDGAGGSPPRFRPTWGLPSRGDGSPTSLTQAGGPLPWPLPTRVALGVIGPPPLIAPSRRGRPGPGVRSPGSGNPSSRRRAAEFAEQKTYSRARGRTCISGLHQRQDNLPN